MLKDVLLNNIAIQFRNEFKCKVDFNVDLAKKSYWKIGPVAKAVFYVNSIESITFLVKVFSKYSLKYNVIGNSTNLLFDDEYDGFILIIISSFFSNVYYGDYITVESGISCPRLALKLSKQGYTGLEHIVGIPGTIGGLVYMNGGSNRHSISEVIQSVVCLDPELGVIELSNNDCDFSYRNSIFQRKELVILEVRLDLKLTTRNIPWTICKSILRERRRKFPLNYPNCGSVFISDKINYDKIGPPGYIIESLGLKGLSSGGAKISELHANFIINEGGAKTRDVISLVKIISYKAKKEYDITLNSEVLFIGDDRLSSVTELI